MPINNFTVSSLTNDFGFYGVLNGKKCFVEDAIIGDIVNINIKKETKDFYVAEKFLEKAWSRKSRFCRDYKSA